MLDMRGKKKKSTGEKWEAGAWLPRTTTGANRHYSQVGYTLSGMLRDKQRKVYPTEASLKRALLSMLPKWMRNMEMTIRPHNMIYGQTNGHIVEFKHDDIVAGDMSVNKLPHGWALRFGEETIRTFARETRGRIELIEDTKRFREKVRGHVERLLTPGDIVRGPTGERMSPIMAAAIESDRPLIFQRTIPLESDLLESEALKDGIMEKLHSSKEESDFQREYQNAWSSAPSNPVFDPEKLKRLEDEQKAKDSSGEN